MYVRMYVGPDSSVIRGYRLRSGRSWVRSSPCRTERDTGQTVQSLWRISSSTSGANTSCEDKDSSSLKKRKCMYVCMYVHIFIYIDRYRYMFTHALYICYVLYMIHILVYNTLNSIWYTYHIILYQGLRARAAAAALPHGRVVAPERPLPRGTYTYKHVSLYIYIYISIYIEREGERHIYKYVYVYILYIHANASIHICISRGGLRRGARDRRGQGYDMMLLFIAIVHYCIIDPYGIVRYVLSYYDCVNVYIYIYTYTYICVYVYICICIYIYIYIYIRT